MFDAHPPFQIDGNFGGAAGIAGMLLQSRPLETKSAAEKFEIDLLPALPSAWPQGNVAGLRARGGFEIGMTWNSGKLNTVKIHSVGGRKAMVRYDNRTAEINLKSDDTAQLNSALKAP